MRVLVCGGRDYADFGAMCRELERVYELSAIELVVMQGGASGADKLARDWCDFAKMLGRQVKCLTFNADWERFGKGAGPRRNAVMLASGKPDLVLAFPGGAGTGDMVRRAKKAAVSVIEVPAEAGGEERRR